MTLFTTPRLTVRRYTEADRDAHAALKADPAIARWQHWPADDAPGAFERFALEPGRHALDGRGWLNHAVTHAGRTIGDAAINAAPPGATIGLCFLPEWRRRGLGRELVEGMAAFLAAHGMEHLAAEIDDDNTPSRALFAALGFRETARRTDAAGPYVVVERLSRPSPPRTG